MDYDVADAGTLIYLAGEPRDVKETVRAGLGHPGGRRLAGRFRLDLRSRPFNGGMSLSPDGRRLAVAIAGEPTSDIWIKQLDRGPALPAHLRGVPQVPSGLELRTASR